MKLILNGGGDGSQVSKSYIRYVELLDKSKPLLYIPLAWKNNDEYDKCLEWLTNELVTYGITKIDMITDASQFDSINLEEYNSLFIGGGNTYKLLNYLKESSGYKKIEDYLVNKNGIVYGGSAGTIIFGKDISTSTDENSWPNLDTSGFNLINGKSLVCHYGAKGRKELQDQYIKNYIAKGLDIISLTEEQSLYISDSTIEIIDNLKDSLVVK